MEIINRNFFRILRAGAFNDLEAVEPMSDFKWNRILQIAEVQSVSPFIMAGLHRHAADNNMSASFLQAHTERLVLPSVEDSIMSIYQQSPQLANFFLNRRLKKIKQKEENDTDSSTATLLMLDLIIYNVQNTLSRGLNLRAIVELGRLLRWRGDQVDFVKLEQWLQRLGLQRLTDLFGSILIQTFHFERDELPFVERERASANSMLLRTMGHTASDTAENWHFRMRTNGMVENNGRVLRRNLRRSMRYIWYNPLETVSNFLENFSRSLSEIEE